MTKLWTILAETQIGPHQGIRHNPIHCQLPKKATRNTDCLGSDNLLPDDRMISTSQNVKYGTLSQRLPLPLDIMSWTTTNFYTICLRLPCWGVCHWYTTADQHNASMFCTLTNAGKSVVPTSQSWHTLQFTINMRIHDVGIKVQ